MNSAGDFFLAWPDSVWYMFGYVEWRTANLEGHREQGMPLAKDGEVGICQAEGVAARQRDCAGDRRGSECNHAARGSNLHFGGHLMAWWWVARAGGFAEGGDGRRGCIWLHLVASDVAGLRGEGGVGEHARALHFVARRRNRRRWANRALAYFPVAGRVGQWRDWRNGLWLTSRPRRAC